MTENDQQFRDEVAKFCAWFCRVIGESVPRNGDIQIHFDQHLPSAFKVNRSGRFEKRQHDVGRPGGLPDRRAPLLQPVTR